MHLKHRSEIDGLRAMAVVPVILFHAGFGWFCGGYVGVDVFRDQWVSDQALS
jgi:peptidoglycan/LPS O-acetylase OafA/YrhL